MFDSEQQQYTKYMCAFCVYSTLIPSCLSPQFSLFYIQCLSHTHRFSDGATRVQEHRFQESTSRKLRPATTGPKPELAASN